MQWIKADEEGDPAVNEELKEEIKLENTQEQIQETLDYEANLIITVDKLVGDESISEAIVSSCIEYTEDEILCIKNVIWVASAESSVFKKAMYPSNNWFWFMEKWVKKKFTSVEESISFWVKRYEDKKWWRYTKWSSWLKARYCASACTYRVGNYNSAIQKLGL